MAITQSIRDRFAKSAGFPLSQVTQMIEAGFFPARKTDTSLSILWRGDPLRDKPSKSVEEIDRKNMELLRKLAR